MQRVFTEADSGYMARALQLARRGLYTAAPNPLAGCVIVNGRRVAGEGWHAKTGGKHAEIVALEQAGDRAKGSDMYLTLEPCTHYGHTPPCADALIAAGVSRVIIAARDPNPLFEVSGVKLLEAAGIETRIGLCEAQACELNRGFFSRMRRRRPWVRIKSGMSIDGRVAAASRESRWITREAARRNVQFQRARCGALLTGAGTVLADNPRLTVRLSSEELKIDEELRQPLRVVVDGKLRTSPAARIYSLPGRSILATCHDDTDEFVRAGVEVWHFQQDQGHVPLPELLERLAGLEVNEVQVEAGPGLSGALIAQSLYDEILLYIAPCLLGDNGVPLAGLGHVVSMEHRERLQYHDSRKVGEDLRILMRREEETECLP